MKRLKVDDAVKDPILAKSADCPACEAQVQKVKGRMHTAEEWNQFHPAERDLNTRRK